MRSRRGGLPQFVLVVGLLAAGALALAWLDGQEPPIAGAARASDGDTIAIGSNRIRIVGIDAPELEQTCTRTGGEVWPCGKVARQHLGGLISGKTLSCVPEGKDKYGRVLGRCSVGEIDIGAAMIEAGLAVSYDDYKVRETVAHAARKGIWSGSFVTPREWRRSRGEAEEGFDLWGWLVDRLS